MQRGELRRRVPGANLVVRLAAGATLYALTTASVAVGSHAPAAQPTAAAVQPLAAGASKPDRRQRSAVECPSGDCQGADCLREPPNTAVDDRPEALMDAADAARASGHPEAAVMCLRQLLHDHSESPLAPLAAFTLGRVLLERLGQPLPAADAFAMARALAPEGSLAQDALAREVEAWSKAGRAQQAFERARLYVVKYPRGRRLHAVQLYGGLHAS